MKNKKLFAILTLVCFMFTLMPVAAFADDTTATAPAAPTATLSDGRLIKTSDGEAGISFEVENVKNVKETTEVKVELYAGDELLSTKTREFKNLTVATCTFYTNSTSSSWTETAWTAYDCVVPTGAILYFDGVKIDDAGVVAELTEDAWAEAAGVVDTDYAGNIDDATSTFVAEDGNQTVKKGEEVVFELDVEDKNYNAAKGHVYIWAEETAGKASSALTVAGAVDTVLGGNVYKVWADDYKDVKVAFSRAGEYTVYAAPAVTTDKIDTNEVAELSKFDCEFSVIKVKSGSSDPDKYSASIDWTVEVEGEEVAKNETVAANGEFENFSIAVTPNNVMSDKYEVTILGADGKALKGATVAIETNSSSIEVNKASDVTNSQGEIDFKVAASVEGTYEIILTVDGVDWIINVVVGNTAAAYIETVTEPTAPLALYDTMDNDVIEFQITDINGNEVKDFDEGMDGIEGNTDVAAYKGKYIVLTEAPADTDLESSDLELDYNGANWYLKGIGNFDAEGTYSVKVILDNGAYATASWEVKKFQTPVMLVIGTSTDVVELGGNISGELLYFDANGVQKAAKDAELAATGYAVEDAAKYAGTNNFKVAAKDDEKYVGATITVTAVSEKYDLVATKDFTVADGAVAIAFVDKSADVNVNNKLEWNVVNSEGTRVALGNNVLDKDGKILEQKVAIDSIKYIVLDKPEGAKVSTNDATNMSDLRNKGIGKLALTSNKVGNVTVQVIVKAVYTSTDDEIANQVKYYTGTQIFAVGTQGVGDVVVMSIGSNEIVINDAKGTIDAAPIVENNRTFVPFRALAEAFGATVAYDEATQAVTAELNGVTVVMTIGSAEYTVNGEAKTADVAPFINGSRTMVPVRFAAEAFGIKVIPTYDENGATADILFNL